MTLASGVALANNGITGRHNGAAASGKGRCRGGCSSSVLPPLLLKTGTFSPPVDYTNPLTGNANHFCVVWTSHASGANGWTDSSGAVGVVNFSTAFSGPNSFNVFRDSSGNECNWHARIFDNAGVEVLNGYSRGTYPYGHCSNVSHVAALCLNNGTYTWWVDGSQNGATGSITQNFNFAASSLEVGGLGASTYPYGSADPLDKFCVAGGTGSNTGVATTDIANSCGQFTPAALLGPQYDCYGCLNTLPNGNAKVIGAFGDSITWGGGAVLPRPYPAKLNALLGVTYKVINYGAGGATVAQIKTSYEGTARNFGRCIFLGGINDIMRDGATGAATYTTASALLDEMRLDGCKPIVVLPTPAKNSNLGWTTARQTEYDSYRSSLSSYCTTNSTTTTCVDTYGAYPASGLGDGTSPPQLAAAADSTDHTHPSQAGSDKIATLIQAAVPAP